MEPGSKIKFRTDGTNKAPCFLSWDFGLVAYPDNALYQGPVSYFLTLLGLAIVFSTSLVATVACRPMYLLFHGHLFYYVGKHILQV